MLIRIVVAVGLLALAIACGGDRAAGSSKDHLFLASRAADTEHVRGPGVPNDPDDTLGTMYGAHEGPKRILEAPACRPQGFALCLVDTARTRVTCCDPGVEGGMPDMRATEWLVFAAARDSMQIFIANAGESYLTMSPASATGFAKEHAINDASWIRARFGHRGSYVYSAEIVADSAVDYQLRVAPVIATGASWPTGRSATVTTRDSVAIAPAAMAPAVGSDSEWRLFAVPPNVYRVLLVRDTNYVACALPCRSARTFVLHPSHSVTIGPFSR